MIFRKAIDTDQILLAYYQGMSAAGISRILGVSKSTMNAEFRRIGLKPRRFGHGGLHAERNPNWKGGKRIHEGYAFVRVGSNTYVREHRKVMEEKLGRPLLRSEIVHHIDGNKSNNAPDNLELIESQSEHLSRHMNERYARIRALAFERWAGLEEK